MIHVGERVTITDTRVIHSMYSGFLDYYREFSASTMSTRICSQYKYGHLPADEEVRDKVFTVVFVREHGALAYRTLAIINDGNVTYIIDTCALAIVFTDLPFREGDKVFIKDSSHVYSEWERLIKHMSTVIPNGDEVYRKWICGNSPSAEEKDNKSPVAMFTVKWIGHHISRPDEAIVAIISNNIHTFIIGVKGIEQYGEKLWGKYVTYVRNWAVVNKNTAQSVRDAAGPKPYAQWLSDKS